MHKNLFFITLWLVVSVTSGYARSEGFPFVGEVVGEKVNVRAGQSANFEKLCQIPHGMQVLVVGKNFSWYKISLPQEASGFIVDKYVTRINAATGVVTADRVNIRATQDVNSTSLGQVSKGMTVKIREAKNGWYKIEPLPESVGWVSQEYIKFKSKDVSSYRPQPVVTAVSIPITVDKKESLVAAVTPVKNVSVTGTFETFVNPLSDSIRYRIVVNGQPACLVNTSGQNMDALSNYKVKAEGITDSKSSASPLPVVTITKIQLIL